MFFVRLAGRYEGKLSSDAECVPPTGCTPRVSAESSSPVSRTTTRLGSTGTLTSPMAVLTVWVFAAPEPLALSPESDEPQAESVSAPARERAPSARPRRRREVAMGCLSWGSGWWTGTDAPRAGRRGYGVTAPGWPATVRPAPRAANRSP